MRRAFQQASKALQLFCVAVGPDRQAEVLAYRVIEKRRLCRAGRQVFAVTGAHDQCIELSELCLLQCQQHHRAVSRGGSKVMPLQRGTEPGTKLDPVHFKGAVTGSITQ